MTCCIHPGQHTRRTRNTKHWRDDRQKVAQFLTQQVGDGAWVGGLVHPDRLVPVDDVAGQAEVVQVEDVGVALLRPNEEPLGLDGCRHGGEAFSVEPELLQQLHRAFLDLPRICKAFNLVTKLWSSPPTGRWCHRCRGRGGALCWPARAVG